MLLLAKLNTYSLFQQLQKLQLGIKYATEFSRNLNSKKVFAKEDFSVPKANVRRKGVLCFGYRRKLFEIF